MVAMVTAEMDQEMEPVPAIVMGPEMMATMAATVMAQVMGPVMMVMAPKMVLVTGQGPVTVSMHR